MMQYFNERINDCRAMCVKFTTETTRFDSITRFTLNDDADPDNNFFTTRPFEKALMVLHKVVDKINLMIYTLRCVNHSFESALKGQIVDNKEYCTLRLVGQHNSAWNQFMKSKFVSSPRHPLSEYLQYAEDIELHTDIIHVYCTNLNDFFADARRLNSVLRNPLNNSFLISTAIVLHSDCERILAETESYYDEQVRVRNAIVFIVKQFFRK